MSTQGRATSDETLRAADIACYMAKEKGRNRVQIHNPSDAELLQRFGEMAWVQRIHDALDEEPLLPVRAENRAAAKRDQTGRAYRTAAAPARRGRQRWCRRAASFPPPSVTA